MLKKKSFTLIEVLTVLVIISSIFLTVIQVYTKLVQLNVEVQAKKTLIENTNFAVEKFNILMKDYTIDYEEYFNRLVVWCDNTQWNSFLWDVNSWSANWYCDRYTWYWNYQTWTNDKQYYCSSKAVWVDSNTIYTNLELTIWKWCRNTWNQQIFYSYKNQHWDSKYDNDLNWTAFDDDDDEDLWVWPQSILDNLNVRELYLIKKDNSEKTMIRRTLITSWDLNWDWLVNLDVEKMYNVQILWLRSFDAWTWHNFNPAFSWVYDWKYDTFACDESRWFKCSWNLIWWWYVNYRLPNWWNDWWINIFWNNITFVNLKFEIFPTKYYDYNWKSNSFSINPYVRIYFKTKIYWESWKRKLNPSSLEEFDIDIQTTLNTKINY